MGEKAERSNCRNLRMELLPNDCALLWLMCLAPRSLPSVPNAGEAIGGVGGEISLGICSLSAPGQSFFFFSPLFSFLFRGHRDPAPISLILCGLFHTHTHTGDGEAGRTVGCRGLFAWEKEVPSFRTPAARRRGRPGGRSRAVAIPDARWENKPPKGRGLRCAWIMGVRHSSFLTAEIHLSEMHRRGPRERGVLRLLVLCVSSACQDGGASYCSFIWLFLGWYRQSNFLRRGSSPCSALVSMKSPYTIATYCTLR